MNFDPDSRKNPVVLYDGSCGMCHRVVTFTLRHERRPTFVFAALESEYARDALLRLGYAAPPPNTVVILDGDRLRIRADAALFLAAHLRFPWRLAGVLRVFPDAMLNRAYDFIAVRRHRWFPPNHDACAMPDKETHRRFRDRLAR